MTAGICVLTVRKRQVELGGDKLNLKKDGEFQKWKRLEAEAIQEVLSKAVVDGKRLSDKIGLLDLLLMRIILLPLGECSEAYSRPLTVTPPLIPLRRQSGHTAQVGS